MSKKSDKWTKLLYLTNFPSFYYLLPVTGSGMVPPVSRKFRDMVLGSIRFWDMVIEPIKLRDR